MIIGGSSNLVPIAISMNFGIPMFRGTPNRDYSYTLWLFNIAMENGPFIDGLPIKNGDFPWLC